MNETWTDHTGKTIIVGEMFAENKMLMDLQSQPTCVRHKIFSTIDRGMETTGKYNHFMFLKFLGRYGLKKVSSSLEAFIPLLQG